MNKDLKRLQDFVDQMKATSSLNEKKVCHKIHSCSVFVKDLPQETHFRT